jgi:D-3-phosphoglycerate dehydrogenase
VKLHTDAGDRWVEGTAFENGSLRMVLVDGVAVEAPLDGTLIIIKNNDQPGVIGDVGTLLGRHKVNIASFALGRDFTCIDCAIGVVKVDEHSDTGRGMVTDKVLDELRAVPNIREAWRVRLD